MSSRIVLVGHRPGLARDFVGSGARQLLGWPVRDRRDGRGTRSISQSAGGGSSSVAHLDLQPRAVALLDLVSVWRFWFRR